MSPRLADLTDHARSLTSAGDLAGARAVLTDALAPVDVDPERASEELADAAALHARLLVTLGDATAARGWAAFAQAAQQRLHGPHDERTIAAAATHAAVLHRVGSPDLAARVYQDIVDRLSDAEGPSSARVLAAEADLATAEHAAGRCPSARDRLTDAWRRHSEEYGDASPAGIKMLARLGAMERDCGLDAPAHEHLAFAQELCARYLPGDHLLTVQVAALARGRRSAAHGFHERGGPPVAPGVIPIPRTSPDAGVTALRDPGGQDYEWPPEGPEDGYRDPVEGRYDTAARPDADRLLPVHLPRPERVTSRRPVVVAGAVTVALVVAAAVAAASLSSEGDRGAAPPAAPPAPSGTAPSGTAPSATAPSATAPSGQAPAGAPPATRSAQARTGPPSAPPARPAPPGRPAPSALALTETAGGVTLRWRYPAGAEGPVLISGGRSGQGRQAFQQLPAGSTSYVVYGLNERADYCFTVSVVYSVDNVAASAPICTDRA